MTKNACCVWDFTVSCEKMSHEELVAHMRRMGKKWVFQKEKGKKTGYIHYQCRISLKLKDRAPRIAGIHPDAWTPTSKENHDNFHYCEKEDTRIEGPWSHLDNPLTIQMKKFMEFELYDWQRRVEESSKTYEERTINILFDEHGNIGKSLFGEYMEYKNLAEEIPPFRLMDDIFQWVYCRPKKKCYFVDMPRGMKKDKMGDFWSGIEIIKNGVAYDKRYEAKKVRFDRPVVWVFTNTLPNMDFMSKDRWRLWTVCPYSKQLCRLEAEQSSCNSD